ncbi:hypothetical protein RR46_09745 [Papilio xuthus]|uniref:Uncharacterized protein n=1 Tax=Papilio xuthus TaxID=66420 RepID=A0A194QAP3_PAPXU|nr:hypothetical protein RR46_09745 [Papilio xuthus]
MQAGERDGPSALCPPAGRCPALLHSKLIHNAIFLNIFLKELIEASQQCGTNERSLRIHCVPAIAAPRRPPRPPAGTAGLAAAAAADRREEKPEKRRRTVNRMRSRFNTPVVPVSLLFNTTCFSYSAIDRASYRSGDVMRSF